MSVNIVDENLSRLVHGGHEMFGGGGGVWGGTYAVGGGCYGDAAGFKDCVILGVAIVVILTL